MADHAVDENDGDIFIYRGGRAPWYVTHVLIDESINEIEANAFSDCERLVQVDTHDGISKVGEYAFRWCESLRSINLKSVVEIDLTAFIYCYNLESVEFGDRIETIGNQAFAECTSLKRLKLPSIITIDRGVFRACTCLTDVEFSERLETIGINAFYGCDDINFGDGSESTEMRLQRIAIPLKRDLFEFCDRFRKYNQFDGCEQLKTVDLVGLTHTQIIASLHMESWRNEMIEEINGINQVLPNTHADEKSGVIVQWMDSVIDKMDHYKAEHCRHVKEGITLLELALWKFKLGEKEETAAEGKRKKAKVESARKEGRITCGADMVIKNVLPFLQLE